MLEFSSMAQDFVEATSSLVGGRTINIMDREGTIIASTEQERIGTFHQGAAEVIATGKPVLIETKDLPRYPGAKEGYNMPIFLKDELIGVVGIFGCEEQMLNVANLLKVYVTQHFAQQAMAQKQNVESEVRNRLLSLLLLGDIGQMETIYQAVRPDSGQAGISCKGHYDTGRQAEKYQGADEPLHPALPEHDVAGHPGPLKRCVRHPEQ